MANNTLYFFKPLKGECYEDGWNGLRTLIVGVAHICTLPCPHHRICGNPDTVRNMDRKCPVYEGKSDYYLLSNSNEIEIRSFIDGEAKYPSYSAFTYYMTGSIDTLPSSVKQKFWKSVAFTNFLQYFPENGDLENLGNIPEHTISASSLAFIQACEELKPQVILAWNPKVCEWLKRQTDSFKYIGQTDMNYQLSVYVFIPVTGGAEGNKLRRLRYKLGIKPEFHRSGWYKTLVEKHLGKCIKTAPEKNIRIIAEILEQCVQDSYLGTSGDSLYFRNSDKYKWTTKHIGWFVWKLKTTFGLGQGANEALAKMFNEYGMTKYSTDIGENENDKLCTAIKRLLESK